MAKTRAQRKAEAKKRAQQQAQRPEGAPAPTESPADAQQQTQVPESADAIEAELAERGADLDELRGDGSETKAPAPSRADAGRPPEAESADKISRRARRQEEREAKARKAESERRRAPKELKAPAERQRGGVIGFFASCAAELRKVQWPDRETLIQATMITIVFIAALAAYLGVLDAIFNFLVQRIL